MDDLKKAFAIWLTKERPEKPPRPPMTTLEAVVILSLVMVGGMVFVGIEVTLFLQILGRVC